MAYNYAVWVPGNPIKFGKGMDSKFNRLQDHQATVDRGAVLLGVQSRRLEVLWLVSGYSVALSDRIERSIIHDLSVYVIHGNEVVRPDPYVIEYFQSKPFESAISSDIARLKFIADNHLRLKDERAMRIEAKRLEAKKRHENRVIPKIPTCPECGVMKPFKHKKCDACLSKDVIIVSNVLDTLDLSD